MALELPAPFKFNGNAPAGGAGMVDGFGSCCVEHPVSRVATIKVAQIVCDDLKIPLATAASSKGFFFIADLPSS
jgi:hypothetical protein